MCEPKFEMRRSYTLTLDKTLCVVPGERFDSMLPGEGFDNVVPGEGLDNMLPGEGAPDRISPREVQLGASTL